MLLLRLTWIRASDPDPETAESEESKEGIQDAPSEETNTELSVGPTL